jgi:outer membrane protein TolC
MKTVLAVLILAAGIAGADPVTVEYDLSGWVGMALRYSPDITIAETGLETARAGLLSARSFLWPSLDLRASAGHSWSSSALGGDYDDETYSASLTLSQELLATGGASWLRMSGIEHEVSAAEMDRRGAVLDLTLGVLVAYYDVVESVGLRDAAGNSLDRSSSQLDETQALYDLGAVTTLELIQAQVQQSRDALTLSQREQGIYTAYASLYDAAGIRAGDTLFTVDAAAVLEPIDSRTAAGFDTDLSENPSLDASLERLEDTRLSAEADSRLYWPSLSASGSWNWSGNRFRPADMPDEDSWHVGVSLSWNVFDGWYRESRVRTSRLALLRAEAAHTSLESSLNAMLTSYRETLLISIRNYELAGLSYDYALEQLELSRLTYDLGGLTLLELLDAQQTVADAEAALVSARTESLRDEARLLVLLGRTPRLGE